MHGDKIHRSNPLGALGTSHVQRRDENYQQHRHFRCYAVGDPAVNPAVGQANGRFIMIDFDRCEDITVLQLNLKRGEDHDIDIDTLDQGTYHKLFGKFGPAWDEGFGPHQIIDRLNAYLDLSPYNNIKDPLWPEIQTIDDFWQLPDHIIQECQEVYGFRPVFLCDKYPDAPRWVLRSFFKTWFYNHDARPSAQIQTYPIDNCYRMPLRSFYSVSRFLEELVQIQRYCDLTLNFDFFDRDLHQHFIDRVPYIDSLQRCEALFGAIQQNQTVPINLNVVEEAYLSWLLECHFNVTFALEHEKFFDSTDQVLTLIRQSS